MLDAKEFTIRIASSGQALKHAEACYEFEHWREGMTWEQFLEFGRRESKSEWYADHGAFTWVLVRKDDYDGEAYSFLETHRKKCFYRPPMDDKTEEGNDIENGWWYNITSVVTPMRYRGNGYATHLVRLLHYMLLSPSSPGVNLPEHIPPFPIEDWGNPPPPVPEDLVQYIPTPKSSILWSDIPIEFYENCKLGLDGKGYEYRKGWNSRLVWDLDVTPTPNPKRNEAEKEKDDGEGRNQDWEFIYQGSLEEIMSILSKSTQEKMNQIANSAKSIFSHDENTPGSLTYIGTRGSLALPAAGWKDNSKPLLLGLRLRSTEEEGDTIVMIALENFLVEKKLLITYIHNLKPDQVGSLISALDVVIRDTGAPWTQGELWGFDLNPDTGEIQDEWTKMFKQCCIDQGRNCKIDFRYGIRNHVLGVCNYTEHDLEVIDTQMWSWV